MTGGSVTPTESGNAMTGETPATVVSQARRRRHWRQPRIRCGATTVKAAASAVIVTSVVQILGSPSRPASPAERGRPKISMNGR
jgi:hypothetical protein